MLPKSKTWSAHSTVGARIAARREELKITKADLVRALDKRHVKVSNSAVGQWEKGDTKNLKLENFFAVADALQVSPRELALGERDVPAGLPDDEVELLQLYRACTPRMQQSLLGIARAQVPDEVTPSSAARTPLTVHEPSGEYSARSATRTAGQVDKKRGKR